MNQLTTDKGETLTDYANQTDRIRALSALLDQPNLSANLRSIAESAIIAIIPPPVLIIPPPVPSPAQPVVTSSGDAVVTGGTTP